MCVLLEKKKKKGMACVVITFPAAIKLREIDGNLVLIVPRRGRRGRRSTLIEAKVSIHPHCSSCASAVRSFSTLEAGMNNRQANNLAPKI